MLDYFCLEYQYQIKWKFAHNFRYETGDVQEWRHHYMKRVKWTHRNLRPVSYIEHKRVHVLNCATFDCNVFHLRWTFKEIFMIVQKRRKTGKWHSRFHILNFSYNFLKICLSPLLFVSSFLSFHGQKDGKTWRRFSMWDIQLSKQGIFTQYWTYCRFAFRTARHYEPH
jgi:hypothetical protein